MANETDPMQETRAEQDPAGRPLSLEGRLEAIASVLTREGVETSRAAMHAMAWWEECMSPVLGWPVDTAGWKRTDAGPRSDAVDALLDRWIREDRWTLPVGEPLMTETMVVEKDLLAAGDGWSGVGTIAFRHAPCDFLPWYRMLCGFAQALFDGSGPRLDSYETARDFRRMAENDPVYLSEAWEESGGPGRLRTAPTGDVALPDFRGNGAAYAMMWWKTVAEKTLGRPAAADDFQSAFLLAQLLKSRTAEVSPRFGSAVFNAWREALVAEETANDDGTVESRFLLDGETVATAVWRPGRRTVESKLRDGRTVESATDDGELLSIEVAEGHRRKGIGTFAMRHAQTRGCVRSAAPTDEARTLWGRHGSPDADGGWSICRVSWPRCRTVDAVAASAPTL